MLPVYLLLFAEYADKEDDNLVVATGSKDKTVKLWKVSFLKKFTRNTLLKMKLYDNFFSMSKILAEPNAENLKIGAYRTLRGHTAAVQSVAAQPTADMVFFLFSFW